LGTLLYKNNALLYFLHYYRFVKNNSFTNFIRLILKNNALPLINNALLRKFIIFCSTKVYIRY